MTMDKDKPAFPVVTGQHVHSNGLTKREYFAALAMQGLLSNPNPGSIDLNTKMAIDAADHLIEELNKEKK